MDFSPGLVSFDLADLEAPNHGLSTRERLLIDSRRQIPLNFSTLFSASSVGVRLWMDYLKNRRTWLKRTTKETLLMFSFRLKILRHFCMVVMFLYVKICLLVLPLCQRSASIHLRD
jgi:hypothetical protein